MTRLPVLLLDRTNDKLISTRLNRFERMFFQPAQVSCEPLASIAILVAGHACSFCFLLLLTRSKDLCVFTEVHHN